MKGSGYAASKRKKDKKKKHHEHSNCDYYHITSNFRSITNQFFMLGILAHIYIILFVSAYAYFVNTPPTASHTPFNHHNEAVSSETTTTIPPTSYERNHHIFSTLGENGGDGNNYDGIGIESFMMGSDPKWMFNYFSIISIILLYVSLSFNFTWPIRIEEALIIILFWMLISNIFNTGCHHCCTSSHSFNTNNAVNNQHKEEEGNNQTHIHSADTIKNGASSSSHDNSVPPPPSSPETTEKDTSNVHVNGDNNGDHSSSLSHHGICEWKVFNMLYSILCIITALLSYLSDVKNRILSKIFRGTSFLSMLVIIFIPVSCNQFHLMDLNVLILKITLYTVIWNLNRFMRYTEIALVNQYTKPVDIFSAYHITSLKMEKPSKVKKNNKKKKKKRYKEEEDEEEEQYDDEEEEQQYKYHKERNVLSSDDDYLESPYNLFHTIDRIGDRLNRPEHAFKSNIVTHKWNSSLENPDEEDAKRATGQISLIKRVYDTYMTYYCDLSWISRFVSWKNRYDESMNYLIDIARTIWILEICPTYLFFVGLVLFWLLYHIRLNSRELKSVQIPSKVMDIIHHKKMPTNYMV